MSSWTHGMMKEKLYNEYHVQKKDIKDKLSTATEQETLEIKKCELQKNTNETFV